MSAGVILQAPPTKRPDRTGHHGRAWQCSHPDDAQSPASIAAWLVHPSRAHPDWSYWLIGAIALDPARGVDRHALQFAEATHELAIVALNPEHPLPDPVRWQDAAYVEPPEIKCQVELPARTGDHAARNMVVMMVRAIIEQGMSPDGCNRNYWYSAINRTAHDIRERRRL